MQARKSFWPLLTLSTLTKIRTKQMNRSYILQIILRGIIGAFISGVGALAQNENGVVIAIVIVFLGVSLFYGLTVFGTPFGTHFSNMKYLFYAAVAAGIIGVIVSTKFDIKIVIFAGSISCIILFLDRYKV